VGDRRARPRHAGAAVRQRHAPQRAGPAPGGRRGLDARYRLHPPRQGRARPLRADGRERGALAAALLRRGAADARASGATGAARHGLGAS
jgi:hypothetical protein